MTSSRRFGVSRLLWLSVLLGLSAASGAQQLPPVAEQMAKTYGLDSFERIEAIRWTFSIPALKLSRTWEWQPKTDTVTYEGKDKEGKPQKITYRRSQLDSQSDAVKKLDPQFFNDQYWLLLPLHVAWDGAKVTDEGKRETPLTKASAELIVLKYAPEGYSPGDTWELYVGADRRIEEISYHRAVPVPGYPNVVTVRFAGHQKAGPLLVSTDHPGTADGKPVQISLSDASVKVTGSKDWIRAQ